MPNLAEKVQARIESLYDTKLIKGVGGSITNKTKHVEDFIGKDKKTRYIVHKNKESGFICCKVLENNLKNLIYISPKVIRNLNKNDPFKSLSEKNIIDFLILIEEIDHWEYLNTKFELKKIPSKFELELQAAVTKYWIAAGSILNYKSKVATRFMSDYKDKLNKDNLNFLMINVFPQNNSKLDKNTSISDIIEKEKYLVADLLARDYCDYLTGKGVDTILFSLRKFYRMDGKEKVDYVMRDFKNNPTL